MEYITENKTNSINFIFVNICFIDSISKLMFIRWSSNQNAYFGACGPRFDYQVANEIFLGGVIWSLVQT